MKAISCLVYGDIAEIYQHQKLIAHRLGQPENKLPVSHDAVNLREALCFFQRQTSQMPVQWAILAGHMFFHDASNFESDNRLGFLISKLANRDAFYSLICIYKCYILVSPLPPMCFLSLYYLSVWYSSISLFTNRVA